MKIPRPTEESKEFFKSIVPKGTSVTVRPMFGNNAAFTNGNMFIGLYGDDIFVRLSEGDGQELLKNKGASLFEPMKGRPMKGYYLIPRDWGKKPEAIRKWVAQSLAWANKLPAKKPKK